MVREVLSEVLGNEYDELWPYIHYALSETRRAVQNGFKNWMMFFDVDDWTFSCHVHDLFGDGVDWEVDLYNADGVIKIMEDRVRVGEFADFGEVRWVKDIRL